MRSDSLSVTLVGPEYPINVGHIARLLKNFGLNRLYLVEPHFDFKVAEVYSAHGGDLIRQAEIISLNAVRRRHDLLVATTAIKATRRSNVDRLTVSPEQAVKQLMRSKSPSLVFGRDTTGLTNDELALCDVVTSIDTGTGYRTLNVAHSAAILLYLTSKSRVRNMKAPRPVKKEMLSTYAHALSLACGLEERKARHVRRLVKRVALSPDLSGNEVALLISLMRKATTMVLSDSQNRSKT